MKGVGSLFRPDALSSGYVIARIRLPTCSVENLCMLAKPVMLTIRIGRYEDDQIATAGIGRSSSNRGSGVGAVFSSVQSEDLHATSTVRVLGTQGLLRLDLSRSRSPAENDYSQHQHMGQANTFSTEQTFPLFFSLPRISPGRNAWTGLPDPQLDCMVTV